MEAHMPDPHYRIEIALQDRFAGGAGPWVQQLAEAGLGGVEAVRTYDRGSSPSLSTKNLTRPKVDPSGPVGHPLEPREAPAGKVFVTRRCSSERATIEVPDF